MGLPGTSMLPPLGGKFPDKDVDNAYLIGEHDPARQELPEWKSVIGGLSKGYMLMTIIYQGF
jgi:hypothetical protein